MSTITIPETQTPFETKKEKSEEEVIAIILEEAADLIDKGWTKGVLWRWGPSGEKVSFCVRGALAEVSENNFMLGHTAEDHLMDHLNLRVSGLQLRDPVFWNNYLAKDGSEVSRALRETAAKLVAE